MSTKHGFSIHTNIIKYVSQGIRHLTISFLILQPGCLSFQFEFSFQ